MTKFTDEEVKDLPRLEPQYGGCFLVLDMERMLVRRAVPDFQLGALAKEAAPFLVYRERYADCPHCRRARKVVADGSIGQDRKTLVEALRRAKDRENYWCNTCQATGWVVEEWATAVEHFGIVTWEAKAAKLTNEELKEAMATSSDMKFRLQRVGWPPAVLAAEAATRL